MRQTCEVRCDCLYDPDLWDLDEDGDVCGLPAVDSEEFYDEDVMSRRVFLCAKHWDEWQATMKELDETE